MAEYGLDEQISLKEALQHEYDKGYEAGCRMGQEYTEGIYRKARECYSSREHTVGSWCELVLRECFYLCQELVPIAENSSVAALAALSQAAFFCDWEKDDWDEVKQLLVKLGGEGKL